LINSNPIPQTQLNLDQVANNTIFIGDQVQEMAQKIQSLENIIGQMDFAIKSLINENALIKEQLNNNQQLKIAPTLSTNF
jgi:regulator of replication initiation timing